MRKDNASANSASQDPTFENQGPMRVFLSNLTDMGGTNPFPLQLPNMPAHSMDGIWIDSANASIQYGPKGSPPPPWNKGTDWNVLPAGNALPPSNFTVAWPVGAANKGFPMGNAEGLTVANRGPGQVMLGGQYTLDLPFHIGGTYLSIHLVITGVKGGSIVLPGFGLWNLGSNPNAWTYVAPTAFDGMWSIMLRSEDFLDYATLSLTYVGYGGTARLGPMSRLVYQVSGSGALYQPFLIRAPESQDAGARTDASRRSALAVFRASGDYTVAGAKEERREPVPG